MAGISFSVFKDKILSGAKRQTIRAVRKNPIKEGETLYMWWKQRSPQREKLGEAVCTVARKIVIYRHDYICEFANPLEYYELIDEYENLDEFAIADGFDNWEQLIEFFEKTHGLPFTGVLIKWDSLK